MSKKIVFVEESTSYDPVNTFFSNKKPVSLPKQTSKKVVPTGTPLLNQDKVNRKINGRPSGVPTKQ